MGFNKSDVIKAVHNELDLTYAEAEEAVNTAFDIIALALAAGEDVKLSGFGKFCLRDRAASTRVNPKTGEPVDVPAKTAVSFIASPILKKRLNRGG